MFVTTLVFAKLVTWMRGQSGTSDLRALAYMDEVAGYVPPTAAPPAKKPILTILKQGRAFGLGLVLSTQNPVDLDYKAMSNAGTWLVGRLQTENDKARVLEGLRSAAGGADIAALDAVDRRAAEAPVHARLGEGLAAARLLDALGDVVPARAADEGAGAAADERRRAPGRGCAGGCRWSRDADRCDTRASPGRPARGRRDVGGACRRSGRHRLLSRSGGALGGAGRRDRRRRRACSAFLATRVALRYDDTAAGIDEQQEFEALYGPLDGGLDLDSETVVDFDDRDFRPDAPAGATYVLPAAPIGEAKFFAQAGKDVQARLVANRALEIFRNKQLKLTSRPGETEEAFLPRCDEAGQAKADEETVKLTKRLEAKKDRLENALELAQRRVEELDTQTKSRQANELITGAGAVLGALFGGKRSARSITNAVGSVASKHGQTATLVRAAEHGGGEGAADEGRSGAARAGDPRRGDGDRRQVEDGRRGRSRRCRSGSRRPTCA